MRENMGLYRGKRTDNGEWVFGYLCKFNDRYDIFVPFTEEENKANEGHFLSAIGGLWHKVNKETVGQFIGLTDKNGKMIFEGDIIENSGCRWVIGFVNTAFAAMDGPDMQFAMFEQYIWDHKKREWVAPDYWEVVGNIHDNPELLEE